MAIDPDVSDAVKLSAIKDALDRGGLKAPNEVVVSGGAQSGFDEIFDDIATGSRSESRSLRGHPDDEAEAMEYEQHSERSREATQPNPHTQPERPHPNCEATAGDGADFVPLNRPYSDVDDDRACPSRSRRSPRPRDRSAPFHVTGDDALRIANQINAATGALRALPPGRSG
jgi:hypothetical protein